MLSDNILIIFVKYPQEGFVKTRLAKEIGKKNACELYRLFVETILARINPVRKLTRGIRPRVRKIWNNPVASHRVFSNGIKDKNFTRVIFYTPAYKRKQIEEWIGSNLYIYSQKGGDLGEKLSHAFRFAFKMGAQRVVAIGTDNPILDRRIILKAFKKLKNVQCVLGPAQDGGYYLIGLSSFHREVFKGIPWSSDKVFSSTLEIIKKLRIKFSLLNENFDIDNLNDLIKLYHRLSNIYKANPEGITPLIKHINRLMEK